MEKLNQAFKNRNFSSSVEKANHHRIETDEDVIVFYVQNTNIYIQEI